MKKSNTILRVLTNSWAEWVTHISASVTSRLSDGRELVYRSVSNFNRDMKFKASAISPT